ncbi:MAG: prepilin-type N-terminal cleavage/methylation domain-containing protein [Gammaproteobacteria bacterium]|nr:prepilin-type N-terminal cleavage/methylation domain-containing protein [Gammaproteobacteria bacterium]
MSRKQKGLSLIELIVVLSIIIIITTIALPDLNQTSTRSALDSTRFSIISMVSEARQVAMTEAKVVVVLFEQNSNVVILQTVNQDWYQIYRLNESIVAAQNGELWLSPNGIMTGDLLVSFYNRSDVNNIEQLEFNSLGLPINE